MIRYLFITLGSSCSVFITVWTMALIAQLNAQKSIEPSPIPLETKQTTFFPGSHVDDKDPRLRPRTLEQQKENFDYTFGRKLLKERQERHLLQWGPHETLTWSTDRAPEGNYQLTIKTRSSQASKVIGKAFGTPFTINIPKSDTWKYKSISIHIQNPSKGLEIRHDGPPFDFALITLKKR